VSARRGELVLTLDGGGSAIKCSVHSLAEARELAVAAEEVAAQYPKPGFAEFDTDSWWRSAVAAMRAVVADAGRPPSAYLGITCTGMRIPFVLLDERGEALAPGVLNLDRRGQQYRDRIRAALGPEQLYRLTGHWPNAKWGLSKLLWYQAERPELWRRLRWILQFHDWLVFRLAGVYASEPSSAAMSQLLDVGRRCWAEELLVALGIERGYLPELHDGGTAVGGLLPAVAREVGLAAGTPVHVGGGDTHVAALGVGGASAGTLVIVGGSTTPLMFGAAEPRAFESASGPLVSPHVLPGLWAFETNAGATGMLYTWLRNLTRGARADGYAALDAQAASVPIGAHDLIVAGANPFWGEAAWERLPPTTVLGLTPAHDQGHLARAVLESISHAVRANLDALESELGEPVAEIVFTGGASRSVLAAQLLSDVLGRELRVPAVREPAALGGAALVAGTTSELQAEATTFAPDEERHQAYVVHGAHYREAYARLREAFGT
jgi:xylulokinase